MVATSTKRVKRSRAKDFDSGASQPRSGHSSDRQHHSDGLSNDAEGATQVSPTETGAGDENRETSVLAPTLKVGDRIRITKAPRSVGKLATITETDPKLCYGKELLVLPDGDTMVMAILSSGVEFVERPEVVDTAEAIAPTSNDAYQIGDRVELLDKNYTILEILGRDCLLSDDEDNKQWMPLSAIAAPDNSQLTIIETPAQSITKLNTLITEINTLFGNLEEAEEVAENAAQSAFSFALEIGHKLIKAKAECGHGNWEATRAQIKSPRSGKPLPSSTATLYQRMAKRQKELEQAEVRTIREAAALLKSDRQLKSATTAEMPNTLVVVERDLVGSLEQLKERFDANQAAAEANHKPSITPAEGQQEAPSFDWAKPDLEPIAPTTITPDTQAVIQGLCDQFGTLAVIEAALKLCSESEAARAYTLASLKRYGKVLN